MTDACDTSMPRVKTVPAPGRVLVDIVLLEMVCIRACAEFEFK